MILDDFVKHPFCQGNIVSIADAVGQIQPSFILRRVVDDVVGGQMGIWDDNAFVVDCIQGGVHKSNLRNLAGNGFQLNEIAALEGLADEDLKPAGKLGDAVLQADAGRHAGRAQGRDEGADQGRSAGYLAAHRDG